MSTRDARELRKTIKTAITFTNFNISTSNLRYRYTDFNVANNIVLSNSHESKHMHANLALIC